MRLAKIRTRQQDEFSHKIIRKIISLSKPRRIILFFVILFIVIIIIAIFPAMNKRFGEDITSIDWLVSENKVLSLGLCPFISEIKHRFVVKKPGIYSLVVLKNRVKQMETTEIFTLFDLTREFKWGLYNWETVQHEYQIVVKNRDGSYLKSEILQIYSICAEK